MNIATIKAIIFDLDGVLVDTAKFHYLAWKEIAEQHGMTFTHQDNELLKGVSRVRSLEIILDLNNKTFTDKEKQAMLISKNDHYLTLISNLNSSDVLPGVEKLIKSIKLLELPIALGSASKNAKPILASTELLEVFAHLVDGNMVSKAKPDPEVFLKAAELIGVEPNECLVFEDAEAGVEAALRAGMQVVGVGCASVLSRANQVVSSLEDFHLSIK